MLDLKSTYPKLIDGISIKNGELCCDMRLQPFSDSDIYSINLANAQEHGYFPQKSKNLVESTLFIDMDLTLQEILNFACTIQNITNGTINTCFYQKRLYHG